MAVWGRYADNYFYAVQSELLGALKITNNYLHNQQDYGFWIDTTNKTITFSATSMWADNTAWMPLEIYISGNAEIVS